MKKIFIVLASLLFTISAYAQQDLLMTQQFFSRINKNPAGIGNFEQIDIFMLGRFQWVDIKDSPKSGILNVQTFKPDYNSGFGFSMSYDDLGPAKGSFNPKLVYAYVLRLREDMVLSMGMSAGVQYAYFDASRYTLSDPTEATVDNDFSFEKTKGIHPDVDFGLEFSNPKYMFGVSGTHLLKYKATTTQSSLHINGYGRYFAELSENFVLAPALAYTWHEKIAVAEINAILFYKNFIWGGMTYHPDMFQKFGTNPIAFQIGAEYKNFRIGYTFDYNFGNVSRLSGTAHELMLSYSVQTKKTKTPYERFE
ncbi:MAG: PorP/SprF family type IX secretion system membrane protein [Paludibacteraceae bacterium]|nr:PorP/SprF family type IX secretion system membrane protein [Paludibacteraceae bacterium]